MSDVEQMEVSLEEAKKLVRDKDDAMKLSGNREFKRLILDGYMKKEAERLVSICADPSMEHRKAAIQSQMEGISHFRQYMQNLVRMGESVESEILEYEETLDELRRQGEDGADGEEGGAA